MSSDATPESSDAGPGPRERLLDAAIAHLAERGLRDASLRSIAAAIGTSHRMLSYHFGSRSGLLTEISRTIELRQRALQAEAFADHDRSPQEAMLAIWTQLTDPALRPFERLFFEMYAAALQADPDAAPLLDGDVEQWIEVAAELYARLGLTPDAAREEARLALAVTRGLLLDLLATGDRDAVDAAGRRFLARYD